MFTKALFIIAKTWKQPKCPYEWIKKIQYIYTMEYYSAMKKNNAICSNMTEPRDCDTEQSQTRTNIVLYHFYVNAKAMVQMNLFMKQKQSHRHRKQTYGYQRGKGGEEG